MRVNEFFLTGSLFLSTILCGITDSTAQTISQDTMWGDPINPNPTVEFPVNDLHSGFDQQKCREISDIDMVAQIACEKALKRAIEGCLRSGGTPVPGPSLPKITVYFNPCEVRCEVEIGCEHLERLDPLAYSLQSHGRTQGN